MEYIKRTENNTRVDVYFDGEKYVFINAFHGCVAVARREGLAEFTNDGYMAHVKFKVEKTRCTISKRTIDGAIRKMENRYMSTIVEYEWEEVDRDDLPYAVSVKVEER
nr:MAG TPA: hypothetical protein [Caudoviricetes sp.]